MAYPVAAGKVDMSSTTMRYIPALYSGKMIKKYYDTTVLSAITNTDYEGEIKKYGDTVYIRSVPTMTIRDYVKGQAVVNEQPESTAVTLQINKGKYWSFVSDDLDKVQTDIKNYVAKWTADGAEQMRIAIDTAVLADIYDDVDSHNTGTTAGEKTQAYNIGSTGSPVTLTKANVLDYIVDCGSVLDEQNVPETGRFLVLPPRICGLIKKSDIKDASLSGDATSVIRTGLLGTIDRFSIYVSNLGYYASLKWYCVFGHKDATTFATQLTETKVIDNPDGFGMLHRGLIVYGYKVIKPEALGCLIASV
jgi:hypothetical protein